MDQEPSIYFTGFPYENCFAISRKIHYIEHLLREKHLKKLWLSFDKRAELDKRSTKFILSVLFKFLLAPKFFFHPSFAKISPTRKLLVMELVKIDRQNDQQNWSTKWWNIFLFFHINANPWILVITNAWGRCSLYKDSA